MKVPLWLTRSYRYAAQSACSMKSSSWLTKSSRILNNTWDLVCRSTLRWSGSSLLCSLFAPFLWYRIWRYLHRDKRRCSRQEMTDYSVSIVLATSVKCRTFALSKPSASATRLIFRVQLIPRSGIWLNLVLDQRNSATFPRATAPRRPRCPRKPQLLPSLWTSSKGAMFPVSSSRNSGMRKYLYYKIKSSRISKNVSERTSAEWPYLKRTCIQSNVRTCLLKNRDSRSRDLLELPNNAP